MSVSCVWRTLGVAMLLMLLTGRVFVMSQIQVQFRPAARNDHARLEAIRHDAFAPIFRSFRKILGDTIYAAAQEHEDNDQRRLLEEMFEDSSPWHLYIACVETMAAGFVSFRTDQQHAVGEIGLNAVDPVYAGRGIGTRMYQFALSELRAAGMKVATVSTGGDPSHQPALAAYRRAGFNVEISSVWLCTEL